MCITSEVKIYCSNSPDGLNISIASLYGVVSNGPGVLLVSQAPGPPQLSGVQSTLGQSTKLLVICRVVVLRQLLHYQLVTVAGPLGVYMCMCVCEGRVMIRLIQLSLDKSNT